jgi:hypothetical protein
MQAQDADSAHLSRPLEYGYSHRRIHKPHRTHHSEKSNKAEFVTSTSERGPRAGFKAEDSATRRNYAHSFMVKITPTSLIDFHGPGLPTGIEYRFHKSLSFVAEGTIPLYYNPGFSLFTNNIKNKTVTSDLKLRIELRKYFNTHNHRRSYLAVEAWMRAQDFSWKNGYYGGPQNNYVYSYTSADATKSSAGFAPLLGTSFKFTSKLFLEAFSGIGIRYLDVSYRNVAGLRQGGEASGWGQMWSDEDETIGHLWRPYLAFGMKISFLL